jgi:hypothetical protein
MVVSVAALQLPVMNVTFFSYDTSNDAHINCCHKYSSSNSVTVLCCLSGAIMTARYYVKWLITVTVKLVSVGRYKAKLKKHYFHADLLICHNFHFPLCVPWPSCFSHQSIRLLTPPRNKKFLWHLSQYHLLFVGGEVNAVLNGSCDMLFHWIQVSHLCLQTPL